MIPVLQTVYVLTCFIFLLRIFFRNLLPITTPSERPIFPHVCLCLISLIVDIIGDLTLMGIPIAALWRLDLPRNQRRLVQTIFSASILTCLSSIAVGSVSFIFIFLPNTLKFPYTSPPTNILSSHARVNTHSTAALLASLFMKVPETDLQPLPRFIPSF